MKSKLQALGWLFVFLSFLACKKQADNEFSGSVIQQKVTSWLTGQKSTSQPNKAANIDLLTKNLDFKKFTSENSDNGEKLLIIPITEQYKKQKNINTNSVATLVIKVNAEDVIRDGNIVLYTPQNPGYNAIPINTFQAIINSGETTTEGEFKFLSVTGRRLYALSFENGSLAKEARVMRKSSSKTTTGTCIDWYLVTTIYYTDGTIEETEEYLTTTCDGCDCGIVECECPDDPLEGNIVEYEYEIARSMKWKVLDDPDDPTSSKDIESVERLRGKRVASEPHGGHFTSASHFWDECIFCKTGDTWIRYINYSIPTPQSISCNILGTLIYDGRSRGVNQTNWWSFADVF